MRNAVAMQPPRRERRPPRVVIRKGAWKTEKFEQGTTAVCRMSRKEVAMDSRKSKADTIKLLRDPEKIPLG